MLNFHSISDPNTTEQQNLLSTQSRETSPTSQGITEALSTASPITATDSPINTINSRSSTPLSTSHTPYMFDYSNQKNVSASTVESIPVSQTTPNKETLAQRINLTKSNLAKRNLAYTQQPAFKQPLLNMLPNFQNDVEMANTTIESAKLNLAEFDKAIAIHQQSSQESINRAYIMREEMLDLNYKITEIIKKLDNLINNHKSSVKNPTLKLSTILANNNIGSQVHLGANAHILSPQSDLTNIATSSNHLQPNTYYTSPTLRLSNIFSKNNIGSQVDLSNTAIYSNYIQPERLIDPNVKTAQISETPKSPIPGILATPIIESPFDIPKTSQHSQTESSLNFLRFQSLQNQQTQQEHQVKPNYTTGQMITITPQAALRILQKHNSLKQNSPVVISSNQLSTSTNTKNSTRHKR